MEVIIHDENNENDENDDILDLLGLSNISNEKISNEKKTIIPIIDDLNYFTVNSESKDLLFIKNFYWAPIQNIINIAEAFCKINKYQNILEIGPGRIPFSLANKFIGYNEKIDNYIEIDIDNTKIPFEDNSLDFVYSRHTLEDIQNPDYAMSEIIRVSNSGYIETPSPLVEITKGVDSHISASKYEGYIHHRYIIWSNIEKCEIYMLPKYSCIINNIMNIDEENYKKGYNILNNYPVYWNNYFIWKDCKPKVIMYKNGVNIGIKNTLVEDYIRLLNQSVNDSIENTNYFIRNYSNLK